MGGKSLDGVIQKALKDALDYETGDKKLITRMRKLPKEAPVFNKARIRKLRKEIFGASQKEFAKILNVELTTLRSWEQGTRKPTKSAYRLLEILVKCPEVLDKIV